MFERYIDANIAPTKKIFHILIIKLSKNLNLKYYLMQVLFCSHITLLELYMS
jgi:hypothetical protein